MVTEKKESVAAQCLAALEEHGPMTGIEIAVAIGVHKDFVSQSLTRLRRQKKVHTPWYKRVVAMSERPYPRAVYVPGPGKNVKPPPRLTGADRMAQCRARKRMAERKRLKEEAAARRAARKAAPPAPRVRKAPPPAPRVKPPKPPRLLPPSSIFDLAQRVSASHPSTNQLAQ